MTELEAATQKYLDYRRCKDPDKREKLLDEYLDYVIIKCGLLALICSPIFWRKLRSKVAAGTTC
jgi:hypothetical protein